MTHSRNISQNQKAEVALTPEEVVALALNEQGYLFHHKLIQVLQPPSGKSNSKHDWFIEASEVPVSLPNGSETRVDIVLRHNTKQESPWRVVVECKRAARDFKQWVFFADNNYAKGPSPNCYYIERADLARAWDGQGEPQLSHYAEASSANIDCPVFDFGVETLLKRDKKVSATIDVLPEMTALSVISEGRKIKLADGKFTDEFKPFDVHLYTTSPDFTSGVAMDKIKADILKEGGLFEFKYK